MASQSVCSSLNCADAQIKSSKRPSFFRQICPSSGGITNKNQGFQSSSAGISGLKWVNNEFPSIWLNRASSMYASIYDLGKKMAAGSDFESSTARGSDGLMPFLGKPGSVSFCGLTQQMVERGKLESSSFRPGTGSFRWAAGPLVLIQSLILPPLLLRNVVNVMIKDLVLAEIVDSLSSEATFYIGSTTFLIITDDVQRPYLEFSAKSWGLITGLRGYSVSAFSTTALKLIIPLFAAYVSWPELGVEGLVAVAPFLVGCLTQCVFEISLRVRGSSCWPLVPIIFEVYRVYQLTKAAHFIEILMFSMAGRPNSPQLMKRSKALARMLGMFKFLGIVSLWCLITFLMRLFPSRPVADNY